MIALDAPVDLSEVLTWPQALVAVVIILAVLVWPGIINYLQNKEIKHELKPNSGGSLRDAVDRTEAKLATIETFMAESAADRADLRRSLEALAGASGVAGAPQVAVVAETGAEPVKPPRRRLGRRAKPAS